MDNEKNFSWPVTSINREDYEAFCKWYEENEQIIHNHQVVIWGAGIRGTMFSIFFKRKGFYNLLFVDSNAQKWGGYIDEFEIISPEELEKQRESIKRIILISTENSRDIEFELEQKKYCRNKDYFIVRTDLYEKYVAEFLRDYDKKTLIMGDCEFSTISIHDKDDRNLREMILDYCGKDTTKVLAMHGMGLRAHYNIFHAQIINGMKPDCLMIMINFDTLTGKQHLLPRSQHSELLELLFMKMKKREKEFEEYIFVTKERRKQVQMEFFTGNRKKGGSTEAKCRNYFKLNYLYDLDLSTEGIVYLKRIFEEASKEGIKVIPFIPPVNYKLGRKIYGEEFDQRYGSNVRKVKELAEGYGWRLLDMSYCLEPEMFAEPTTADETANERGRERIVGLLCDAIKEM